MHGSHGLHAIGAGDLADLAEDEVVHPAQLGRDDLRHLPRRRDRSAARLDFFTHSYHPSVRYMIWQSFECSEVELFHIKLFDTGLLWAKKRGLSTLFG